MLTLDDIRAMALALRFARVAATDASPTDAPPPNAHPQALSLATDPRAVLPEAQSVLLLVMPYTPYRARPGEAEVDAYYIASNTAHENARLLAEEIAATGAKAVMTSSLRTKPLAVRYLGEPLTVSVSIRAEGGSARVRVMNTLFGVREIAGRIG